MYIIQEIQTNNGISSLLPPVTQENRLNADSAFFSTLSFAAVSTVQVHTVIMYDEHGNQIRSAYYEHISE